MPQNGRSLGAVGAGEGRDVGEKRVIERRQRRKD